MSEGEIDDTFYIILSGKVAVNKGPRTIAFLSRGECFGEMSYLSGQSRAATVVAETDCILMKISGTLLDKSPDTIQVLFLEKLCPHPDPASFQENRRKCLKAVLTIDESLMKPKVCLVTLGCAKNLVDSENMLGLLKAQGFAVAPDLEESRDRDHQHVRIHRAGDRGIGGMILEIAAMKSAGKLKKLYVTGCLVQRFGYKLKRELPEVDGWLGTGEIHRIGHLLCERKGGAALF
jgi:hypothetical protein